MQKYELFFKKQNFLEKIVYRWHFVSYLWHFLCHHSNAYMNAPQDIHSLAVFRLFQTL